MVLGGQGGLSSPFLMMSIGKREHCTLCAIISSQALRSRASVANVFTSSPNCSFTTRCARD